MTHVDFIFRLVIPVVSDWECFVYFTRFFYFNSQIEILSADESFVSDEWLYVREFINHTDFFAAVSSPSNVRQICLQSASPHPHNFATAET